MSAQPSSPPPVGPQPDLLAPVTAEAAPVPRQGDDLGRRLERLERQVRISRLLIVLMLVGAAVGFLTHSLGEGIVARKTLVESTELKLLGDDGTARLFLRTYSGVPVMQVMDASGTPRMSLGLRFDDSPFLVLSDATGRKRFSVEMDSEGDAALRIVGPDGQVKSSLH